MNDVALARALYTRLNGDETLREMVGGRLYDSPPEPAEYPYIRLGEIVGETLDTDGTVAEEFRFRVEAWDRPRRPSRVRCAKITNRIRDLLHREESSLAVRGATVVLCLVEERSVSRHSDGRSFFGVVDCRVLLDY